MIRPSVKAVNTGTQIYGLPVDTLQTGIEVGETEITGTLNHVTEYEQFSDVEDEQSGNFLALALTAAEGVTIKTQVINGTKGEVIVDDGYCVYRITDNQQQSIKVTYSKDDVSMEQTYSLANLTCNKV